MDRDEVKVHKLTKKERGQYPAILTEQTWSIKDLFRISLLWLTYIVNLVDKTKLSRNTPTDAAPQFL